jgi:hypothetical protein
VGAGEGVAVACALVAVGGTGVSVGRIAVAVGGTGVSVDGARASVGGSGVSVGGAGVAVGGTGLSVGSARVSVGSTGVLDDWGVFGVKGAAVTAACSSISASFCVGDVLGKRGCQTLRVSKNP